MSLEAIFFDVDDTLFSTTEFARTARRRAVDAMLAAGLRAPREEVTRLLREIVTEFSSNYPGHFDELLRRLPEESYRPVNPAMVIAAGVTAYHDTKFRNLKPYPDAAEVLRILDEQQMALGIITAGVPIKQAEKIIRLRLSEYFDPRMVFIADQVGIEKSNPELYSTVCKMVGLEPQECMYVGDNPPRDIDPPNRIGMTTVQSVRSGKYVNTPGETEPDYRIQDFWDLLDLLERDFGIKAPRPE